MAEDKKPKIEKITQEEYEDMLVANMKTLKDNLKDDEIALEDFLDLYKIYMFDKNKYRLEFWKQGQSYTYKRFKRKIGF